LLSPFTPYPILGKSASIPTEDEDEDDDDDEDEDDWSAKHIQGVSPYPFKINALSSVAGATIKDRFQQSSFIPEKPNDQSRGWIFLANERPFVIYP
jgi:hypothetical protein